MISNRTSGVPRPVVLVVLDGWGERDEETDNAILQARTPAWDRLRRDYPHGRINASELEVGLPPGQMGNSEVGHMNIGAGRVVMQDLPRIDRAIADGTLARDAKLRAFIDALKASGGVCHLLGLLSSGGVHSHQSHMAALANLVAEGGVPVRVHAFTDGRDTPPKSALDDLARFRKDTEFHAGMIRFATVSGRYYAMDRDRRWERVEKACAVLMEGQGISASAPEEAVRMSYGEGRSDEFILPAVMDGYTGMRDGDGLIMANFRADRAREILCALLDPAFGEFERRTVRFASALSMTEYSERHNDWMPALFPPAALENILGEVVARAGKTQLRIAETEKYAHVTFFFNGGREREFPGEERILVPSPKVATYDLKPEMSASEVTDRLLEAAGRFDLIVVNYANADMVGHTGNLPAAMRAIEAVDACLGRLAEAVLPEGALLITADHGNAEMMHDEATRQAHTAHTLNLVPVLIAAESLKGHALPERVGRLADIAPTLLDLMQLPRSAEMTGRSLLEGLR